MQYQEKLIFINEYKYFNFNGRKYYGQARIPIANFFHYRTVKVH
jgi:hypothetical protein